MEVPKKFYKNIYAFSNFLSYEENGDEDAEKYLEVNSLER